MKTNQDIKESIMKKRIIIFVCLILVVIVGIVLYENITLNKVLEKNGIKNSITIESIERLTSNSDFEVRDIKPNSDTCKELVDGVNSTKLKYMKNEKGIVYDGVIYTIYARDSNAVKPITISLTKDEFLHINSSNKTYKIKNDVNLYELTEKTFVENK